MSNEKMSMEERIGRSNEKLGASDRSSMQRDVELAEDSLNHNLKSVSNPSEVRLDLERKKMILQHDDDLTAKGNSKEVLFREMKDLETSIRREIPSKTEMWARSGSNESAQAIRHNMWFQRPEMDAKVRRWQEIRRRLEPENPYAQNLENIRPDK